MYQTQGGGGEAVAELRHLLANPPSSPGAGHFQNPHQAAHAALQHLRDAGDPTFLFLRCLLVLIRIPARNDREVTATINGVPVPTSPASSTASGNKDEIELMFHCATGVRDTLLERWDTLPKEDFLYIVRDYLMSLGLWGESASASPVSSTLQGQERPLLPRVVSTALLSAAAAFWKRCWLDIHHQTLPSSGGETSNTYHPNVIQMTNSLVQMIQSKAQEVELHSQQVGSAALPFVKSFPQSTLLFQYLEEVIISPLKERQQQHHSGQSQSQQMEVAWRGVYFRGASLGCFFLSSLLAEISGSVSSGGGSSGGASSGSSDKSNHSVTRYRQSLEFHRFVFQHFSTPPPSSNLATPGNDGLDAVLTVTMKCLSNLVQLLTVMGGNAGEAGPNTFAPTAADASNDPNSHSSPNVLYYDIPLVSLASAITTLTTDVFSWDFTSVGSTTSNAAADDIISSTSVLVKPPPRWRGHIVQPDFLSAIFTLYGIVRGQITGFKSGFSTHNGFLGSNGGGESCGPSKSHWQQAMGSLAHALRQLLLQLSSVSGTPHANVGATTMAPTLSTCVFSSIEEQCAYAAFLVEGCLNVLTSILLYDDPNDDTFQSEWREGEAMDVCSMVCRLIQNFKLNVLAILPSNGGGASLSIEASQPNSFWGDGGMIYAMCTVAREMCTQMLRLVEGNHGNVDEYQEEVLWREEALDYILEGANLLLQDQWLQRHSGGPIDRAIAQAFSPLYATYITCRIKMSRIEENYLAANETDLDEIREDISSQELEEQMVAVSMIGRANLPQSLSCLTNMMQESLPRLQTMFEASIPSTTGSISPDCAALLEQARMIIVSIAHLLTDDAEGETPMIPEALLRACQVDGSTTEAVSSLVQLCMSLAEHQASRIAVTPNDPRLSPLLGKTLVWFLDRWASAYILPSLDEYSDTAAGAAALQLGALSLWGTPESAQQGINFCTTLCLHYFCFWPQEQQLQDNAVQLLLSLAKRKKDIRRLLVSSPAWQQLVSVHIVTGAMRHSSTEEEVKEAIYANGVPANTSINMVRGYQRLPYNNRGKIFSAILIGCSDAEDIQASGMLNKSLEAVHRSFTILMQALG
jgi:hypothetical protein